MFIKRNGGIFERGDIDTIDYSKGKCNSIRSYFESLSMTTDCHPDKLALSLPKEMVTDTEILKNSVLKGRLDIKFISFRNKFNSSASSPHRSTSDVLKLGNSNLLNTNKTRSSSALPNFDDVNLEQESPSRVYRDADDANDTNYSKLKLTRSNYPIPFIPILTKHSEELFTLQWNDFTKRYDTISLILFSPEKGKYHKTEISITQNHWHIEIPEEFQTTTNYYYLYCYHFKRKTFS
ncbi:MAG: hypothetical protein KDK36_06965 [Leptospiraceae bacterium]|nr:hypothetical protein [Leptospiraceae bacterium]